MSESGLTDSTAFAVLRLPTPELAELLYLAATAMDNIQGLTQGLTHLADGAAYPAVRSEVVAAMKIVRAEGNLLLRVCHFRGPVLQRIAQADHESRRRRLAGRAAAQLDFR